MYYPVTDYIALALIISFLFLTLFICLLCLKHERIKKETIRQKNAHILDHTARLPSGFSGRFFLR